MNIRPDTIFAGPVLTDLRLTDGRFAAVVRAGPEPPVIEVEVDGQPVGTAALDLRAEGGFAMAFALPRQCLRDGDAVVVFRDQATGVGLARYLVSSGPPRADDVLAELAILRAEFAALKRAFLAEAWHEKLRKADRPLIVAEVVEAVAQHLQERDAGGGT